MKALKEWQDKIAELTLRGRVRDTFDPAQRAREWNTGRSEQVDTHALSNVEFVTVTGGGTLAPVKPQCRSVVAVHQPALSVPPTEHPSSSAAPIRLPYPPSGNTAVRHANGAHYLRAEVTTYRQAVAVILQRSQPIQGRYELHVELSPPDARRRDIDNALKSLLDACVKAGWLPDDSMAYMRKLTVVANDDRRGDVVVRATAERQAA